MKIKKTFRNLSLKYKFLLVFFFLITLPTICIGIFIYLQANQAFNEQAYDATQSILDKIEGNLTGVIHTTENISAYGIYNEDFRTFMAASPDDFNEPFYNQSVKNIEGYLTFQLLSNQYINSVVIEGYNGNFINVGEPLTGNEKILRRLANDKKGGVVWSDTYKLESGWNKEQISVISLSRVINDYNNIKNAIGFIRIRLDARKINEMLEIPNLQEEVSIYLTDNNEHTMLKVQTDNKVNFAESVLTNISEDSTTFHHSSDNNDYLIVNRKLEGVDWNLTAVVSESRIATNLVDVKNSIRNMVIILTFMGLIASVGYYYADIRRIMELTKTTERIENKDFSVKVDVDSKDEIGKLGDRFNKMVETIRSHIDIEYKLKIKQKESELKALQNQIDPHFLYNTLDMIRWKARMENAHETSHLIELLSRIFRNTLKTQKLWVTIKDELLLAKSYLELQEKRLNGTMQFSVLMDYQIKNYLIIKQTIQPLVENAIKHGFFGKRDQKLIKVRCYIHEEMLFVDVIDNGKGMEATEFTEYIHRHDGHALKNLQDRIQLAFGSGFGLILMDMNTSGTWIRVQLPILTSETDIQILQGELGETNND